MKEKRKTKISAPNPLTYMLKAGLVIGSMAIIYISYVGILYGNVFGGNSSVDISEVFRPDALLFGAQYGFIPVIIASVLLGLVLRYRIDPLEHLANQSTQLIYILGLSLLLVYFVGLILVFSSMFILPLILRTNLIFVVPLMIAMKKYMNKLKKWQAGMNYEKPITQKERREEYN